MQFSIFWSHPIFGGGSYIVQSASAETACDDESESLVDGFVEEDNDLLERQTILDDLDLSVWAGAHTERPLTPPDHVLE